MQCHKFFSPERFVGLTFGGGGGSPSLFCFLINYAIMYSAPTPLDDFAKYDEPRLHMERLMKARLVEFDLSMHILIPLDNAGIKTIGDLTSKTRMDLMNIRRLGVISVGRIEDFLSYHGLTLSK